MKKRISIYCLTLLLLSNLPASAREHHYPTSSKEPIRNGLWWQQKSSIFKEGFMGGYKLALDHAAHHPSELDKFPSSELLTGLDHFYDDFRNRLIMFDDALGYVEDQLRGVPDDKLAVELQHLRAAAAPTGDQ